MGVDLFDLLADVVEISNYSLPIVNASEISALKLWFFEAFDFFDQLGGLLDDVHITTIGFACINQSLHVPLGCLESFFHTVFVSHELLNPFFEELGTIEHNLFSLPVQKIN